MKRISIFFALIFCLAGCTSRQSTVTENSAVSAADTATNIVAHAQPASGNDQPGGQYIDGDYYYRNLVDPICISETAKLYEKPDTNSAVLGVLKFGTALRAKHAAAQQREITSVQVDPNTGHQYRATRYLVQFWYQAFLPGMEGYVRAEDIGSHSYPDHNRQVRYVVLTDRSKRNPDGVTVCTYDQKNNTLIDSLQIKNMPVMVVKFIDKVKWSNVNMLIRISDVSAECGGGGGSVFIADVNGTLTEVISSSYTNDDEEGATNYSTTVSLPVETESGEFRMIETESLPGDLQGTVLEDRPVIKRLKTEKPVLGIDQQPLLDSAGNPQWKSSVQEEFFLWNGTTLQQVKSTEPN